MRGLSTASVLLLCLACAGLSSCGSGREPVVLPHSPPRGVLRVWFSTHEQEEAGNLRAWDFAGLEVSKTGVVTPVPEDPVLAEGLADRRWAASVHDPVSGRFLHFLSPPAGTCDVSIHASSSPWTEGELLAKLPCSPRSRLDDAALAGNGAMLFVRPRNPEAPWAPLLRIRLPGGDPETVAEIEGGFHVDRTGRTVCSVRTSAHGEGRVELLDLHTGAREDLGPARAAAQSADGAVVAVLEAGVCTALRRGPENGWTVWRRFEVGPACVSLSLSRSGEYIGFVLNGIRGMYIVERGLAVVDLETRSLVLQELDLRALRVWVEEVPD
ncbi:MAG: hypothetical protein MUE73_16710 [Planctomycetes bacterium]|jgi:hypothetical protein|nr:hypothetical protein [Planctomycetota bacterium]